MSRVLRLLAVLLCLLTVTFVLKASLPQVSTGSWQAAGILSTSRVGAAAVALPDGRILITGGSDSSGAALASAELFNTDGTFSSAAPMNAPRAHHAAIVLPDGRVLVTGGYTSGGGITNSAETYDPQTNTWRALPSMLEARAGHTMSQLLNGDVLLAGGENSGGPVNALEVFDETSDTFSSAGALVTARKDHAAAVLNDGHVLIAGGTGVDASSNSITLGSTEIFDADTGSVSAGPAMSTARAKLSATTLLDGTVALIGGNDGSNDLASIEIYDPAAGSISASPATLATARSGHQAFLLPHNSSVLVVGGTSAGTELASAELFLPWNTAVQATGSMASARIGAAGAPLTTVDGLLLVAGGQNAGSGVLASAELYGFATVKTDQSDYAPGTTVNISGSGWQPGETVTLTLVESPNLDTHPPLTAVADQNGNIFNNQFSPDSHDIGVRFYLTAAGSQSQAQATFTDSTATNTSLTSSPNPSNVNQSVTFTATVRNGNTQGSGTLVTVGSVGFYDQTGITNPNCSGNPGTQIGTTQPVSGSGTASVTFSFTSAGSYKIGACYNGTGGSGTQNSSSPSITQTVNGATVSATNSTVTANPASVTADGSSTSTITVTLKDASNNPVSGKAVSLTAGSGSSTITTVSGTTNSSGQATFSVKDTVAESVTYTAKDTTDNITITQTATVTFTAGSVSSGNSTVVANPTSVTADGTSTSTITVTLKDSTNNPVSGKTVTLAQGTGSSTISAASGPSNSSGVVTFTVKDTKAETVTYSATDTTDSIAISQTAAVTFTAGPATKFVVSAPATANLGAAFSFTVTAQDANNNTATGYTGTVHFTSSDAQAVLPANSTLTNGSGSFSATLKTAGNQTITATDTVTAAITGTSNNINVSKADTTTVVASSVNPSVYGQPVTFTATVSAVAPASGTPTGTVTFKDGANTLGTATLSGGQATFSSSSLSVASHSITAEYGGDGNFNISTSSALSQTVNQADTTTSVVSSANPSVFGQPVTFTATVSAVAPAAGTATGTVTFKDGATTLGTGTLNGSGQATFSTASLSVGPHSITAVYAGDSNFNGSTSSALSQTVNKADTTTSVVSSANPSVFGQPVTFTATVSAVAPAAGTATGTVTFKDGATTLGTGTLNGSGQATLSTGSLSVGPHSITAVYAGDSNFNSSTSSALAQTVNKADTTAAITSDTPDPSVVGQAVTVNFSLTVNAPGSGTPTGNVTVSDGTVSCTAPVAAGTCSLTFTSAGAKSLTATYAGDGNFNGSTSAAEPHTVNKADTTTTITSTSPNSSVVGQSVTVNYTVTVNAPGSGTPTGNVTVSDGTVSCTAPVAAGNCSLTFTSAGAKSLTATYAGDTNFNGSTSATAQHTVNKAETTTTITSDNPDPSVVGQPVTVSYTVTVNAPGSGTPTGNVTVSDGTVSCTGTVAAGGCSLTFTSAGARSLTATYAGDSNFNNSASAAVSHTVDKASTSTALSSSVNPSVFGQSVTFTASVSVVAPGAGAPSGTVTFKDGATILGTGALSNAGQATFSTSSLSVASHSITAEYAGDSNFNPSASSILNQTVNRANSSTVVVSSANPAVFGQSVTFTATVSAVAPGAGSPSGTIQFQVDGNNFGSPVALSGGSASSSAISSLSVGNHLVTAIYSGDTNFNDSTGTLSGGQEINKAATSTTVAASVNPSVFGQSVTFSATVSVVAPGAGSPSGTIQFKIDNVAFGSPVALSGGTATSSAISSLSVGNHAVTAEYSGDGNFNSSGGTLSGGQTVNKADTNTTVTSVPNPSVFGQSVTFSATVSVVPPGTGTPTGTVTFADGGTAISSCTNVPLSSPVCSIASLNAGSHSITAIYSGDANFNATGADAGSTATPLAQTVNQAETSTIVNSISPEPSVTGQSYLVSWSVTVTPPGSGTPTGLVTVSDGTSSCSAAVSAGSCSLASITAGIKAVTASYAGDSNFKGSSGNASHTVNKANTTTTVTLIVPSTSVTGQSYTVSWSLTVNSPGSGTPLGTVTVTDGTGGSCMAAAASSGSCLLTSTSAGTKTITATYGGDLNYNGSFGTASHTVNKAPTATTITSFVPEPSLASASYTVNFSVAVASPGAGTPTGSVSINDTYGNTCTGTLSGGSGSCVMNTSLGEVGSLAITASYSGDSNFLGSSGTANHTVQYEPAGTLCLGAPSHQILQPVNADGSSVFKQGSTVPAKFRVCDVNGTSIGTAGVVSSFRLIGIQNGTVVSTVDESVDSTNPDTSFRWDPTSMQWIFNMSTKSLSANRTYLYMITLNDGTTIAFQFGLK